MARKAQLELEDAIGQFQGNRSTRGSMALHLPRPRCKRSARARKLLFWARDHTVNAGLYKTFTVWERVTAPDVMAPESTATSVTNSPNWGNPVSSITMAASLRRIASASGNRGVRLGVRMQW